MTIFPKRMQASKTFTFKLHHFTHKGYKLEKQHDLFSEILMASFKTCKLQEIIFQKSQQSQFFQQSQLFHRLSHTFEKKDALEELQARETSSSP